MNRDEMEQKQAAFATLAVGNARRGKPSALIARLRSSVKHPLTRDEIAFIADVLERTAGPAHTAHLRTIERTLIALQVEGLMDEPGVSQERAMRTVMRNRGKCRNTVLRAINAYRQSRGTIPL